MSLYRILLLCLIKSSFICVYCTEEVRFLDDSLSNTRNVGNTPLEVKLTGFLEIKLNEKSELWDPNVVNYKFPHYNNINNGDNFTKIAGNSNNGIFEQLRMINEKLENIANAIRDTNLKVDRIEQSGCNTENGGKNEYTGSKTSVGVHYKRSTILNGKLFKGISFNQVYPRSCKEIYDKGINVSGIFEIQPKISKRTIVVLCDMETRGGGWTHIQKRYDGSQDFDLDWRDYKFGFGDLNGELWIGLENIYKMTVQDGTELLVELEDRDGTRAYAHYSAFKVGQEKEGYPLSILSGYSGDAGDPFTYHLGSKFSTRDFDQDAHASLNCAGHYHSPWWQKSCFIAGLNGKYINLNLPPAYAYNGLDWQGFKPHGYSYAKSRMLIRSS